MSLVSGEKQGSGELVSFEPLVSLSSLVIIYGTLTDAVPSTLPLGKYIYSFLFPSGEHIACTKTNAPAEYTA